MDYALHTRIVHIFKVWDNQYDPHAKCPLCDKFWQKLPRGVGNPTYGGFKDAKHIAEMAEHLSTHKEYTTCKVCNALVKTTGISTHKRTISCNQRERITYYENLGYKEISSYIEKSIEEVFNKELSKKIEKIDWKDLNAYTSCVKQDLDEKNQLLTERSGLFALVRREKATWCPAMLFKADMAHSINAVHELIFSGTTEQINAKKHYLVDLLKATSQEERDSIQACLELEVHGG